LQSGAFASLDQLIEGFKNVLPLHNLADTSLSSKESLFIAKVMTDVATIKLHLPFSAEIKESRNKYILAAQSISVATKELFSAYATQAHTNPILGVNLKLPQRASY
jgi:hypothetical protein